MNWSFGRHCVRLLSCRVHAFNLRFPGQYFDSESGTHYNYFRDYDPGIGRYVQSDPIGLDGGLNNYGYVAARPLKWSDRFGLITPKTWSVFHAGLQPRRNPVP